MKKASASLPALIAIAALLCTVTFYIHRNQDTGSLHIRSAEPLPPTQAAPADMSEQSSGLVDINTADLTALMSLPGIGQTLANRIIDYRDIHGPFESVAGLLNVEGIGAGKLESILNLITTGGTT